MVGIPAAGGPEPAAARFRLASPVTATVLAVLSLMLLAGALVLSAVVEKALEPAHMSVWIRAPEWQ